MGLAVGLDGEAAHDIHIGYEAVPTVRVHQVHGGSAHDVDACVDQNEFRLSGDGVVVNVLPDPKEFD